MINIYDQNTVAGLSDPIATSLSFYAKIDDLTYPRFLFHRYAGDLYAHDGTYMHRCTAAARSGVVSGATFPVFATGMVVNSSVEYQGYLYMGGLSSADVTRWNGSVLETDEASVVTAPTIMAVFRETLLAFGTHSCKKRNLDGSWSSVSMPGGVTSFKPRAAVTYKDRLYIGGYDDATDNTGVILTYDGTSLTVARTLTVSASSGDVGCVDLAVTFGYLYYAYNALDMSVAKIGRYDGTTWTDSHKDMNAVVSGCTIGRIYPFRGSLLVGLAQQLGLYASPLSDTSGTYVAISTAVKNVYDLGLAA